MRERVVGRALHLPVAAQCCNRARQQPLPLLIWQSRTRNGHEALNRRVNERMENRYLGLFAFGDMSLAGFHAVVHPTARSRASYDPRPTDVPPSSRRPHSSANGGMAMPSAWNPGCESREGRRQVLVDLLAHALVRLAARHPPTPPRATPPAPETRPPTDASGLHPAANGLERDAQGLPRDPPRRCQSAAPATSPNVLEAQIPSASRTRTCITKNVAHGRAAQGDDHA